MTIQEFKAFLEGMDVQGCPTPEQWARIKDKIEALEVFRVEPVQPYPLPSTIYWQAPTTDSPLPQYPYTTCGSTIGTTCGSA